MGLLMFGSRTVFDKLQSLRGTIVAAAACLVFLVAISPDPVQAQVKGVAEHYWYDGETKRSLWIDSGQVADFSTQDRTKAAVMKAMPATKSLNEKMSPLFRDQADENARARALPGGVIVRLKQIMPDEQARSYLNERGLRAVREIGSQTGLWLVESPPGMASLELANRLHEKGEFVSASPNWWQPRALK